MLEYSINNWQIISKKEGSVQKKKRMKYFLPIIKKMIRLTTVGYKQHTWFGKQF